MSSQYPPLTCKEVKKILAYLGFVARPQKGKSHEQWVKEHDATLYKVTVDCPTKSPFTQTLIKSMAAQAGMTKKEFYRIFRLIKYPRTAGTDHKIGCSTPDTFYPKKSSW